MNTRFSDWQEAGTRRRKRWSTDNRMVCGLIWWFYESHAPAPKSVYCVYSRREYFTHSGHHIWVDRVKFWRTLYRAVGMTWVYSKRAWDWGECKLWPPERPPEDHGGM